MFKSLGIILLTLKPLLVGVWGLFAHERQELFGFQDWGLIQAYGL